MTKGDAVRLRLPKPVRAAVCLAAGEGLLLAGLALWSVVVALVVAGVQLVAVGLLMDDEGGDR